LDFGYGIKELRDYGAEVRDSDEKFRV